MSLFLGPIHYWMYGKIVNAWRRQGEILKTFCNEYGDKVILVAGRSPADYEKFNNGLPLEKIIGNNPIHGWLQEQINFVEMEEAKLISILIKNFGATALEVAKQGAFTFGTKCAAEALKGNSNARGNPSTAYELFLDYDLDGMPCDYVTEVREGGRGISVKHYECLHYRNWSKIDVPFDGMCEIVRSWIKGFFHAMEIVHTARFSIAKGDKICEDFLKPKK